MIITEQGIRIDLPLLEYAKRRAVDLKHCYLMLHKDHVEYKVIADYERLLEDIIVWEPTKANFRFTRLIANISDVSMYWDNDEKIWSLCLEFSGITGSNEWMFDDPKQALGIYKQLSDYMVGIDR